MFPITLSFTVHNATELAAFSSLLGTAVTPEATPAKKSSTNAATEAAPAPTGRTAAAAVETAAPAKTADDSSPTAASAEAEPQASTAADVTLEDVIAAFKQYCKSPGVPAAQAILGKFGLPKLTAAAPEQYAALLAAFTAGA